MEKQSSLWTDWAWVLMIEWKVEVEATMNYDSTVSNFEYLNIMVNVIFLIIIMCMQTLTPQTQQISNRSASLLVGGQSLEESFNSQASLSPSHSDVLEVQPGTHQQLPISPISTKIVNDPPESPKSSSSDSSATNSSLSPDSATLTPSEVSAESSIVSQPEHTSTPTKSQHQLVAAGTCASNEGEQPAICSPVPGFKMVIDNIDKTVKPRNQTIDAQTQSLHYVQVYAVKDPS